MKLTATERFLSGSRARRNARTPMRKMGVADRGRIRRACCAARWNVIPNILGSGVSSSRTLSDGRDGEFAGRERPQRDGTLRAALAPQRWRAAAWTAAPGTTRPPWAGWYSFARESRQEVVFGPYDEQLLTGLPVLCLSRVAPILERDRFIRRGRRRRLSRRARVHTVAELDNSSLQRSRTLEAMLERWHVFLKDNGEIEFASGHAKWLLTRHVGRCRRGRLPASLNERLAVTGPTQSTLHFHRPQGGLQITALRHPHTGRRVLSEEQTSPLTPRRQEPDGAGIFRAGRGSPGMAGGRQEQW